MQIIPLRLWREPGPFARPEPPAGLEKSACTARIDHSDAGPGITQFSGAPGWQPAAERPIITASHPTSPPAVGRPRNTRGPPVTARRVALIVTLFITPTALAFGKKQSSPPDLGRLNRQLVGKVHDYSANHGEDRRFFAASLGQKRDAYVYVPPGYGPAKRDRQSVG